MIDIGKITDLTSFNPVPLNRYTAMIFPPVSPPIDTKTLSKVFIIVVNNPTSLIVPEISVVSTQSPLLNGLNNKSITPAATFDRVPCKARPIAKPAAPKTAIIEVV